MALIPLVNCDRTLFLIVLVSSQATFGMQAGGELPLPSDLTHEFTATLFAIANMFGMMTGFVGPYIAGMILDMEPSMPKRQWSYIIYFTSIINVIGGLIFVIFGSAERQNWGHSKDSEEDNSTISKKKDIESISKNDSFDNNGNYLIKRESF